MCFLEVELKSNTAILPLILLNAISVSYILIKARKNMLTCLIIYGNGGTLIWLLMGFDCYLVEKLGTTPKQNFATSCAHIF